MREFLVVLLITLGTFAFFLSIIMAVGEMQEMDCKTAITILRSMFADDAALPFGDLLSAIENFGGISRSEGKRILRKLIKEDIILCKPGGELIWDEKACTKLYGKPDGVKR